MTRLLNFFILLGASAIVMAEPLYKWVESDGSITFSPKPPAAGIEYETVIAPTSAQLPLPQAAATDQSPALSEALPPRTVPTNQNLRVAPQQGIQTNAQPAIQRAPANRAGSLQNYSANRTGTAVMGAATAGENTNPNGRTAALTARNRKQRQCEDLKKRVVSLERRLKTRLTPEDMDNTVVHMARYQRSYDQHCVQ